MLLIDSGKNKSRGMCGVRWGKVSDGLRKRQAGLRSWWEKDWHVSERTEVSWYRCIASWVKSRHYTINHHLFQYWVLKNSTGNSSPVPLPDSFILDITDSSLLSLILNNKLHSWHYFLKSWYMKSSPFPLSRNSV